MDPFGASIVAASRRDDFAREAANERLAKVARRDRKRHPQAEARPEPRPHEVTRPAII